MFNRNRIYRRRPPLGACYYEVYHHSNKKTLLEYLVWAREFTYIAFNHYNTHANIISWFYKWGDQRLHRFSGLSSQHVVRALIQIQLCLILKPTLFSVHQPDYKPPLREWCEVSWCLFPYSQNCAVVRSYRFQGENLSHSLRGVSFLLNKGRKRREKAMS